jgi:hypothetical protein
VAFSDASDGDSGRAPGTNFDWLEFTEVPP